MIGGSRGGLYSAVATAILAAATAIAALSVLRFADEQRSRDMASWRARLGIVADSRLAQAQGWLDQQLGETRGLAENQSVQLYLTLVNQAGGNRNQVADEPAQSEYLRNLLNVVGERSGFVPAPRAAAVGANLRRAGAGGIALIDHRGWPLISTPDMPAIDQAMLQRLVAAPANRPSVIDIFPGATGQPSLGFLAPVYPVQSNAGAAERIGYVFGVRELDDGFYRLLRQPGAAETSAETLLLRRAGNTIEYLSPQNDGTPPLRRTAPIDASDMAEAQALGSTGAFIRARDYRGSDVLAVARSFAVVPWTLLYKVDRDEVLADSDARRRSLIIGLGLVVALVSAGFVAVWWYASSRRATDAAQRYRELARRFERQEHLLRSVTDSQPDLIYLVDRDGAIRFANAAVAGRSGVGGDDLVGKQMAAVLGPDHARHVAALNRKAGKQGRSKTRQFRYPREDGRETVVQTSHVPLLNGAGPAGSTLVVERDVTQEVDARERRARSLQQLVQALVRLIERRDPYCADQAARVRQVADAVAEEMNVDAEERATIETAASLMNLGKVMVPPELLVKTGPLSDDEKKTVRDSILNSAELVAGIEFDGPVQETLRQLQEHVDGTGYPKKLNGDRILLPARILAVANAFVGMVSPRAWREAIGIDQAIENLRGERDRAFDRGVVAALENALENRGGRRSWQGYAQGPHAAPESPPQ